MRVAVYGGSFDPPHVGHLLSMAYVLGCARVDRLMMVPCFRHPFEKRLSPFADRYEMCRLTAASLGPRAVVSDVESRLGGESKTLRTVKELKAARPEDELVLVIGADLLDERERWFGYAELAALVKFFVVGRAGYHSQKNAQKNAQKNDRSNLTNLVPIPDVSSTEIRARVRAGQAIAGLVPAAVADYLVEHHLYDSAASREGGEGNQDGDEI